MRPFLLLVGPSGSGKTTLIKELRRLDERFVYISPYITRPLREGEVDKIAVDDASFDEMVHDGAFVIVNEHFGARYGTPRHIIDEAIAAGKFPILDWLAKDLGKICEAYGGWLYTVVVRPSSLAVLQERLAGRPGADERLRAAHEELSLLRDGAFDEVCVTDGEPAEQATILYKHFLAQP